MYCRNCSKEFGNRDNKIDDEIYGLVDVVCSDCGKHVYSGEFFCQKCGGRTGRQEKVCLKCGTNLKVQIMPVTNHKAHRVKMIKLYLNIASIILFIFGVAFIYTGIKSGSRYLLINNIFLSIVIFIVFLFIRIRIKYHYDRLK